MAQDILQALKSNKSGSVERETYSLTETVGIIAMFNEGLKVKQVSELTGRSVNSLRYKFLENTIKLNGEETIRSVKRFANMEELYAHFKAEYSEQDLADRIESFKTSIQEVAQKSA